jgi:hypothetical protein
MRNKRSVPWVVYFVVLFVVFLAGPGGGEEPDKAKAPWRRILIEDKVFTGDQISQMQRYAKAISHRALAASPRETS